MYMSGMMDALLSPNTVVPLRERTPSELPVVGRLFQRDQGSRQLVEAYEIIDAGQEAGASLKKIMTEGTEVSDERRRKLAKDSAFERATRKMSQQMTALTRQERKVRLDMKRGTITASQGNEVLKTLGASKREIAARLVEARKRVD
jgi:hypothetical protein